MLDLFELGLLENSNENNKFIIKKNFSLEYYPAFDECENLPYSFGNSSGKNDFIVIKTPTSLVPPNNIFNIHFETIPSYKGYEDSQKYSIINIRNDFYRQLQRFSNVEHRETFIF